MVERYWRIYIPDWLKNFKSLIDDVKALGKRIQDIKAIKGRMVVDLVFIDNVVTSESIKLVLKVEATSKLKDIREMVIGEGIKGIVWDDFGRKEVFTFS